MPIRCCCRRRRDLFPDWWHSTDDHRFSRLEQQNCPANSFVAELFHFHRPSVRPRSAFFLSVAPARKFRTSAGLLLCCRRAGLRAKERQQRHGIVWHGQGNNLLRRSLEQIRRERTARGSHSTWLDRQTRTRPQSVPLISVILRESSSRAVRWR